MGARVEASQLAVGVEYVAFGRPASAGREGQALVCALVTSARPREVEMTQRSDAPEQQTEKNGQSSKPSAPGGRETSGSRGAAMTSTLRQLSYYEGEAALSPDGADAQAVAARGLSGGGQRVDGAAVQRMRGATGADVSHAREHTGPAAAEACGALGVKAYAMGGEVAYGTPNPAAHVRYHELAHVAQNAGGVHGYGVGRAALESNADAVADAVLGGQTANVVQARGDLAFFTEAGPDIGPDDDPGDGDGELTEEEKARGELVKAAAAKVKKASRKKKFKRATAASELLGLLSGCDDASIAAILAAVDLSEDLPAILHCLATTDAGLKQPRQAIAVIAACPSDVRAEAAATAGKKAERKERKAAHKGKEAAETPAELFYCAMTEAERATFVAEHPCAVDVSEAGEAARARKAAAREADSEALTKATAANDAKVAAAGEKADAAQEAAKEKAATPGARGAAEEISELVAMGGHELALDRLSQVPDADFAGVIFTLDARSQVKALVLGVGFETLWNRNAALGARILAARAPERNAAEALELLRLETVYTKITKKKDDKRKKKEAKKGVADDILTPERAYTAFQFLKALPPAHRERFERLYPALVVKMHMSLNKSMREADDTNFFGTEAADQETIAAHLAKLEGDALWTEASATELKMTLSVLLKGGQRDAVANRIIYMVPTSLKTLFEDDARRRAVQGALGKKADAPEKPATAEVWRASLQLGERALNTERDTLNHGAIVTFAGGRHGLTSALMQGNRSQRREAKAANKERREKKRNGEEDVGDRVEKNNLVKQVFQKKGEVQVDNIPLDQLQWTVDMFAYGGDVAFTDLGKRKGDNKDDKRNTADLSLSANDGTMSFRCDTLMLDRLRFPTGGMTVDTGAVTMTGVKIDATFPTAHNPGQAQSFMVDADSIDISSIFVTWPGAIIGIDKMTAGQLCFSMEEAALSLNEDSDMAAALGAVMKNNPARRLMTAVLQFIGYGMGMNGADKNAAGELTQTLGNIANAFMNIPPGALGGVGLDVIDLGVTGVIANADTYVQAGSVHDAEMVWDSRPTRVAEARLDQIRRQRESVEEQLAAVDGSTKEGSIRQSQLRTQLAAMTDEVAAIGKQMPRWQSLEALWQEVYEAQLVHGDAAPDRQATLARIRGMAAAAGIAGADAMSLVQIGDVVSAELRTGEGMVASVGAAKVEGAVVGGVAVGEAGATQTELAVVGSAMGTATPADVRQKLGGAGAADKEKTSSMTVTATVGAAHAKDVVYERGASVARLEKLQDKRDALLAKGASKLLPTERAELAGIEKHWHEAVTGGPDGVKTWGDAVDAYLALMCEHGDAVAKNAELLAKAQRLEAIVASSPITVESAALQGASVKLDHTTTTEGDVTTTSDVMAGSIGQITVSQEAAGEVVGKALDASATATTTTTKTGEDASSSVSTVEGDVCIGRVDAVGSYGTVGAEDVSASGSYSSTDTTKKVAGDKDEKTNEAWSASTMVSTGQVTYADEQGRTGGAANMMASATSGKDVKSEGHLEATGLHGSLGQALGDPTAGMSLTALTQQKAAITKELDKLKEKTGAKVEARRKALEKELEPVQAKLDAVPGYEAAAENVERISKEIAGLKAAEDAARAAGDDAGVTTNAAALVKASEALEKAQEKLDEFVPSGTSMKGDATVDKLVVDVTGGTGDKLLSGDVSGPVTLSVSAGPIALPAVDYFGSSMRVQMSGGSAATLTATANATFQKLPGHPNELIAMEIEQLDWPKVEARGLLLTLPVGGELVEIGLPTAEMNGLSMSCVHLNGLSADAIKEASGRVDVASVKATLSDKLPFGLKASGQLNLEHLYADAVSSGDVNFGLAGLNLEDLGIDAESAQAAAKNLAGAQAPLLTSIMKRGGRVTHKGKITVGGTYNRKNGDLQTTVGLGDIGLKNIHYKADDTSLDVGKAELKGATITAKANVGDAGTTLQVLSFGAHQLIGDGIVYDGMAEEIERDELGHPKTYPDGTPVTHYHRTHVALPHGTLNRLKVTGLAALVNGSGTIKAAAESGDLQGFEASLSKDGTNVLQANVSAKVEGLEVDVTQGKAGVESFGMEMKHLEGKVGVQTGDQWDPDAMMRYDAEKLAADVVKVKVDNVGKDDQHVHASADHVGSHGTELKLGYGNSDQVTKVTGDVVGDGFDYDQTKDKTTAKLKSAEAYYMEVTKGGQRTELDYAKAHGIEYTSEKDADGKTTQNFDVYHVELEDIDVRNGEEGDATWFHAHLAEASISGVHAKMLAEMMARDVPGARGGMPSSEETTTNTFKLHVDDIYSFGDSDFTFGWKEGVSNAPLGEAGKEQAIAKYNDDNAKARTQRDEMRGDKELGEMLRLVNGELTVVMESGATHWILGKQHRITLKINNGVLDLSDLYVAGGAGIDVDWSHDDEGRITAVIDAVGFKDLFTLAEISGKGQADDLTIWTGENSAKGRALGKTIDKTTTLQDLVATQATPMTDAATIDALQADLDGIARLDRMIDAAIAELAADGVVVTADPVRELDAALAEIPESHAGIKQRLRYLVGSREITELKTHGGGSYPRLSLMEMSADIHWGRPDGKPVRFRGWDIGAQDVNLKFQPLGNNQVASASLKKLSVKKADGSFELGIGEANLGATLDQFMPGGKLDIMAGRGDAVSNPIHGPITPGTHIKDVDVTTRAKDVKIKRGQ